MNSKSLEAEHVQRLFATVQGYLHYFNRLEGRMTQKHFPLNDPLYLATKKAQDAVRQLSVELNQLLGPGGDTITDSEATNGEEKSKAETG